jgi:hypothetical protein
MAKRAKGLKILKIIIILAITFLAGIVVTFCQKQSKPVVTDENRTTQTLSSKAKKHKKAATKKETGKETKVSATTQSNVTENEVKNTDESDRVEGAKKALDKYCRGEYITGQEAAEIDWYCKKYRISPQSANDTLGDDSHYVGQTKYDDQEPEDGNVDEPYNGGSNYVGNEQSQNNSDQQTAVADNTEATSNGNNNYQGGGNYGNN